MLLVAFLFPVAMPFPPGSVHVFSLCPFFVFLSFRLEAIATSHKKLLGAPGLTARSRTLLGAPGIATRSILTSNKKLLGTRSY